MTIVKTLTKKLGGTWQYAGPAIWLGDNNRMVCRCSLGVDQFDNPLPGCAWFLYENGTSKNIDHVINQGTFFETTRSSKK